MARLRILPTERQGASGMQDDTEREPSRTRLKQQAEDLQVLGERLVELPEDTLARLSLPPQLLEAVRVARGLTQRGALRRQRQYIGRLMRALDSDAIRETFAVIDRQQAEGKARFHEAEGWRERLLGGDAQAMKDFFDAFPGAERQRLRQLVTRAAAEAEAGRPPQLQRELFREIRRLCENRE